jgi:hypothetical protein
LRLDPWGRRASRRACADPAEVAARGCPVWSALVTIR